MRQAFAIFILLVCTGCTHKLIANPYQTFTPDMSYSDVRKAVEVSSPNAFDHFDQAMEQAKKNGEKFPDNFQILTALVPSNFAPFTYFFFQQEKLKSISLRYVFLPHEAPPGRSEKACDAIFNRVVVADIIEGYGKPTNIENLKAGQSRDETINWKSNKVTAEAKMHVDGERHYPETTDPSCGSIISSVYFGTEPEKEKFEGEWDKAVEESRLHNP
tara:strand:- start:153 stop:800 length:648 start_codon:yes stop_codon:yes gene_type:complete